MLDLFLGMLLRFFVHFYDMEIIEEEAFLAWKEDITQEFPGKGKALFQVNHLFVISLICCYNKFYSWNLFEVFEPCKTGKRGRCNLPCQQIQNFDLYKAKRVKGLNLLFFDL